jgi:hypothetical protein
MPASDEPRQSLKWSLLDMNQDMLFREQSMPAMNSGENAENCRDCNHEQAVLGR